MTGGRDSCAWAVTPSAKVKMQDQRISRPHSTAKLARMLSAVALGPVAPGDEADYLAPMKSAVVVFPGSNCDRDCMVAVERSTGSRPEMVWHGDSQLPDGLDLIVLPGGFSYGDYLRAGAMAAHSPVMAEVKAAADRGVAVVGICNGFQILCEAGMLPGALLRNAALKYVCKTVELEVTNAQTRFTAGYQGRRQVKMTVGNGEGNYFADEDTLDRLEGEGQVVFRYLDNPNGSARGIAGIVNERGNVLGIMPHPDRAFEPDLSSGTADGAILFQSVAASA
jgi:phosphoribosylformylglycinamidine synthase subunit PurQ / glutaminase